MRKWRHIGNSRKADLQVTPSASDSSHIVNTQYQKMCSVLCVLCLLSHALVRSHDDPHFTHEETEVKKSEAKVKPAINGKGRVLENRATSNPAETTHGSQVPP